MNYLWAFLLSLGTTMLLVKPLTRLAHKLEFVDKPTERKKHKIPMPLIGGTAMFIGFLPAFFIFVGFFGVEGFRADARRYVAIIIGALIFYSINLVDDFFKTRKREFPVYPRFIAHIAAATLVYFVGIRFYGITMPWSDTYIPFHPVLQYFLTVAWIFGVTTVINWSDGLDGMAGGFAGITACTLFIFAMSMGEASSAFMSVALIGCIIAFLRYNFFPAKIFMGDSGTNFLGYMLAVISLHGAFKQATLISIVIPVIALGIPIFDGIFVVIKRFISRKPIYKADRSHLHHRLEKRGLSPFHTIIFLYLFCICVNLTSIIIMLL